MGYLLTLLAALLAGAGYFAAWRRARDRESSLKTALDQRTEKLTFAEQELIRKTPGDPVTGLPTQQTFQEFLEHEWRRAARARTPVSLLSLELDHFKAYDERLGSTEGAACLKSVAAALKPIPHRPGDLLARYGDGKIRHHPRRHRRRGRAADRRTFASSDRGAEASRIRSPPPHHTSPRASASHRRRPIAKRRGRTSSCWRLPSGRSIQPGSRTESGPVIWSMW